MIRLLPALLACLFLLVRYTPVEAKERFFCYVSLGGEDRIAVYPLDPATGKLGEPRHFSVGGAAGSLAVDPTKRFLYAAVRSTASVAALKINPADGGLTPLTTVKLIENPVYVATDPTGRFLLTSYYGAGKAAVYSLGTDGKPGAEPVQVVTTGKNPHSIQANPNGRMVYVPNTGADQIQQFLLDPKTGKLTPADPAAVATAKGSGPRHFRFHPTKPFAYFVNEAGGSVTAFRMDGAGRLTPLHTLSTLPAGYTKANSCADLEITPDGKFVYCSNRGHDSLAGFAVDAETGRLTALGQTPTEKTPRDFDIDPTGNYVFAAGQDSGRLASYRLGTDGKLTPLAVYEVGKSPSWVLILRLRD